MPDTNAQTYPVFFVNAFANSHYAGNTAAVVIVDQFPAAPAMQAMAAEFGFSETVYVLPMQDGGFHIRWFTPEVEVKLCGHGTMAASAALWEHIPSLGDSIRYVSLSGQLTAIRNGDVIRIDLPLDPPVPRAIPILIANALSAVQPASAYFAAATKNLMLVYDDPAVVYHMQPDFAALAKLKDQEFFGIAVTAAENGDLDYVCRYFAPWEGINEDPVTGSAQTFIAPYWCEVMGKSTLNGYQASRRGGLYSVECSDGRVLIESHAFIYLKGVLAKGF